MCLIVELVACPLILKFLSIFLFWVQTVDLSKLETAALKRYRRHFKLVSISDHTIKWMQTGDVSDCSLRGDE
jgi:hypothetical protein